MLCDITSIGDALIELSDITNGNDFESVLFSVKKLLKTLGIDSQGLKELEQLAYYPINEGSTTYSS